MMSWRFISGSVDVTLPINPNRVSLAYAAEAKELSIPGLSGGLIISLGLKADKLVIGGLLFESGKDKDYLEDTYLLPLKSIMHNQVEIQAPNERYDDTKWVFYNFEFNEKAGFIVSFEYTMEFRRTSRIPIIIT